MAREDENDALVWGGESDDPTYLDGTPATVAAVPTVDPTVPAERPASATNPFITYAFGLFGGVYALYAIGWVLAIQRDTFTAPDIFSEIMYQLGQFLAILAPVIWIGLSFLLTRHRRPLVRILWLVIGVLLLAPWPFILPAPGVAG